MLRSAIVLLAAGPALLACRGEDVPVEAVTTLPFGDRAIEDRDFAMASPDGDSVWFRTVDAGDGRVRLARYHRADAGLDSLAVVLDAMTKLPVESYQHVTTTEGVVTGHIAYGAGFEGQALRTVTSARGRLVESLRTPEPYLDPAQIPQTLAALDLASPDTLAFNYVSPYEELARNALLVVGREERIRLPAGPVAAVPVRLRVSGHQETFWFDLRPDGARLVRWRDERRGVTWDRVEQAP